MKTLLRLTTVLCGLALTSPAFAAEATALNHLPEGTQWVMHVNMTAIRDSAIGKHVTKKLAEAPHKARMDLLADMLNFDPRTDLEEATVFGPDEKEDHAVMVIKGNVDGERLRTFVESNEGFEMSNFGGTDVLSWIEDKGKRKGLRSYGKVLNNQFVVIGSDGPSVAKALQSLDGGVGLAKDAELLKALNRDAVVMAAASAQFAKMASLDPENPMLQQAKSFKMSLQEKGDKMALNVGVQMTNPEAAEQLLMIGRGGMAMMEMQAMQKEELADLMEALDSKMDVEMDTVVLDVSFPSQAVIDCIEKAEKE